MYVNRMQTCSESTYTIAFCKHTYRAYFESMGMLFKSMRMQFEDIRISFEAMQMHLECIERVIYHPIM